MNAIQKLSVIFFLALLGFMDAGWLTVQSLVAELRGMCGPVGNCPEVLASKYARLFGIPLASFGMTMYAIIVALAYYAASTPNHKSTVSALRNMAILGTLFSLVLMYIQAFVLHAFCLYCTLSAVIITLILLFSISVPKSQSTDQTAIPRWRKFAVHGTYSLVVFLCAGFIYSIGRGHRESTQIVARVGDEVFTEKQLNEELKVFIRENQRQLVDMKLSWIDNVVSQRLLRKEAGRRNLSVDALVAQAVGPAIAVSDSEVAAFGKSWDPDATDLNNTEKEYLRSFLFQQKKDEKIRTLVNSLKQDFHAEVFLKTLTAENAEFDLKGSPYLGKENAPVTLVVFTDFECPFCATVAGLLKELHNAYKNELCIVIKNFPLDIHRDAPLAAEAALCANEQGKFQPYHDLLFSNQGKLDEKSLVSYAEKAGIDIPRFKRSLESKQYQNVVARDKLEGERIGVTGTPTVFINGRPLLGPLSLERLDEEVSVALK